MRARLEPTLFVAALAIILGLAAVQTMGYLDDFVTYSQPPGALYGTALVAGALLGWACRSARAMLLLPLAVIIGAATIFFGVAWSPVWLGDSRHEIAVLNEVLRQSMLVAVLVLAPLYMGAIGGFIARQVRE